MIDFMMNAIDLHSTLGPSPGALRYPQHRVSIRSLSGNFSAYLGDQLLAFSKQALCVSEDGYQDVFYFPPSSVCLEKLQASDSVTTCPFKGVAAYYAAEADGRLQDIAWFYPNTYNEAGPLKSFIAFYSHIVTIETEIIHER